MNKSSSEARLSTSDSPANVGVVVVTYESQGTIERCLESLRRHEPSLPVAVVDNNSPSGPPAVGDFKLIQSPTNTGYGGGCNLGSRAPSIAGCDYWMFLNPDVELAGPSISQLAAHMSTMPGCGAATGHVVNRDGERMATGWGKVSVARVAWALSGLTFRRARFVIGRFVTGGPFTSGATMAHERLEVSGFMLGGAMMVRASTFSEVGGFDEGFFMSWDDIDFGYRLRAAGWELWALPTDPAVHDGGASSAGVSALQRREWYLAGLERFARKHLSLWRRRVLIFVALAVPALTMRPFRPNVPH